MQCRLKQVKDPCDACFIFNSGAFLTSASVLGRAFVLQSFPHNEYMHQSHVSVVPTLRVHSLVLKMKSFPIRKEPQGENR